MTSEESSSVPPAKRRVWWIVGAVVLVVAVVIAIGVATGWGGGSPASTDGSTPRPSASSSSSAAPAPSESSDPAEGEETPESAAPRPTAPPVALDQAAEPAEGVRVTLGSITAFDGQASVPGEVEGPALQVTVNVENTSKTDALTDTLIVNVFYGPDRTPANILVRPRQDLPLTIPAGESAKGVYAFSVPADARGQILVEVDLSVDLPVVLFEGAVS